MHELSIGDAVLATVVRHAAGRRVAVVHLRVGALRQVVPQSLAFWFGLLARDTVCDGARLEQELVAARLRCPGCEAEWSPSQPDFRCPRCAGTALTVVRGEELEVESIDVEEARCTA